MGTKNKVRAQYLVAIGKASMLVQRHDAGSFSASKKFAQEKLDSGAELVSLIVIDGDQRDRYEMRTGETAWHRLPT